jgi:protein Tex
MEENCRKFVGDEVPDAEDALHGARDIVAEWINEDKLSRDRIRNLFRKGGLYLFQAGKEKRGEGTKYRDYFDFEEKLKRCPSHRLLAMRSGRR